MSIQYRYFNQKILSNTLMIQRFNSTTDRITGCHKILYVLIIDLGIDFFGVSTTCHKILLVSLSFRNPYSYNNNNNNILT